MPEKVAIKARMFPLADVRLLRGGPFERAQQADRAYLLRLEPDRLLSNLRRIAGLKPKAASYGGWDENNAGIVGHYLSACAQMAAATGDPEIKKRVDYVVAEMAECQKANGDGGLYTFQWDKDVWFAKLRQGEVIPTGVNAWYVGHKVMAGLRDAYALCGNAQAKNVLIRYCDFVGDVTAKLTETQWQTMLNGEHGAPHEILADIYAYTGERKYLDLAEKFRHQVVFDPQVNGSITALDNKHANTQIPKLIGYERIYELTGQAAYHDAAIHFWEDIVSHRTWANGGNSQWEAFFPAALTADKLKEPSGPETCNTYNMLKLTQQLYELAPSARLIDYAENALYNHILTSQSLQGGEFVYLTPMRPGHYRVFGREYDSFWCCVGTGMENHARYGELIYAQGEKGLYVNLFLPSEVKWREKGVTLRQETKFPEAANTALTLTLAKPQRFSLMIRRPEWVAIEPDVTLPVRVNGKAVHVEVTQEGYAAITRVWKSGDRIQVELPMRLRTEPLPGPAAPEENYVAFKYGPVLLAGALGTDGLEPPDFRGGGPNGPLPAQLARKIQPVEETPALIGKVEDALSYLAPVAGQPLTFHLTGETTADKPVTLIPFYRLYDQRYAVYWSVITPEVAAERTQRRDALRRDRSTLAARTIDRVRIGDNVSEKEHDFASEKSAFGNAPASTEGEKWRDASGWFRYNMTVVPGEENAIRVAYWGGDKNRTFDILINGQSVATERLTGDRPGDYVIRTYPMPAALTQSKDRVTVEFRPQSGSVAGGVFDVRTVRPVAH